MTKVQLVSKTVLNILIDDDMICKICFIVVSVIFWKIEGIYSYYNQECPPSNKTGFPHFSRDMEREVEMIEIESNDLSCCIYGVSKITWWFKSSIPGSRFVIVEKKESFYYFGTFNRTLIFRQPRINRDNGTYRCIGENDLNNTISNETVLYIETKNEKRFELNGTSKPAKIEFKIYSNYSIFCLTLAHKSHNCTFNWSRFYKGQNQSIITGTFLTTYRMNASLINGFQGSATLSLSKLDRSYIIYNLTLNLENLKESEEGIYKCNIEESTTLKNISEQFFFQIIRSNPLFLAIGLTLILILLFIIAYIFQYDLEIIVKHCIRQCLHRRLYTGKYNFFFIYDFEHEKEYQRVFKIVKEIESKEFSSFFYHRNQTYGKDIIEDISNELQHSDVVVIWATPNMWNNSTCRFSIEILINRFENIKRIYVMTSKKKKVLRNCNSTLVLMDTTKSCISSKIYSFKSDKLVTVKADDYSEVWYMWHTFISWLIASLPLKSIPTGPVEPGMNKF